MRVLLDCRPVRSPVSGVARYCIELSRSLRQMDGLEMELYVDRLHNEEQIAELGQAKLVSTRGQVVPRQIRNLAIEYLHPVAGRSLKSRYDLVHESYFAALSSPATGPINVATVHDVIPIDAPELFNRRNRYFSARNLDRQARTAERVIAVSEFTRQRILDLTGCDEKKVVSIPNAVRRPEGLKPPSEATESVMDESAYLFHIGNIEPRKNLEALFRAFSDVKSDYEGLRLVLAGKENFAASEILENGRRLLGASLEYLGPVSEDDKWHLLDGAAGVVFPSIYEGFGIPVIEAYLSSTPIVFSRGSSLSELAVTQDQLFDPLDEGELAEKLRWLLEGGPNVEAAVSAGALDANARTWEATALRTRAVYEEAIMG